MNQQLYLNGKTLEEITLERLKEFEPEEGYYLAFSGGKDSVVLLDLAKRAGVKFDAHYNLTTVDPPELVWFIRRQHPEVIIEKPKMSMWQLIVANKVPPTRLMRYCCKELKERGGSGRLTLTGIRWSESTSRSKRRMIEHCRTDHTKNFLHPIIDWNESDVWGYIRQFNIPYCTLYDFGIKRLGCIGCPMKNQQDRQNEFVKYPLYQTAYLRAFSRMLKAREGMATLWKSEYEVLNWWIYGKENTAEGEGCFYFGD